MKIKTILLNAMYSGRYIQDNLGHEAINLFASDNGKHYVYINPLGKISQEAIDKYDIECILLGELVKDGVFKVYAKATGLKMLDSTKKNIKETGATNGGPLSPQLEMLHLKELQGVTYNGVSIEKLFDEPTQVLATFEAEEVVRVAEATYIYAYNYEEKEKNRLSASEHDARNPYKFAKTNPYMFFPQKNRKGESMKDYKELQNIIKKTKWENQDVACFTPSINIPEICSVEIMGKEDSELAYSNMICYWLNKNRDILKQFVIDILQKKDKSIPNPSNDIKIEREKDHTDLLIRYGETRIVIENKINAEVSVYAQKAYSNQLVKYKEELKKKAGVKDVHCFLLSPDYRNIKLSLYDKDYKELKYSVLFNFFNGKSHASFSKQKEQTNTVSNESALLNDFCLALQLHARTFDTRNEIRMMRRFREASLI